MRVTRLKDAKKKRVKSEIGNAVDTIEHVINDMKTSIPTPDDDIQTFTDYPSLINSWVAKLEGLNLGKLRRDGRKQLTVGKKNG